MDSSKVILFKFQNEVAAALAEAGNNGHHKLYY